MIIYVRINTLLQLIASHFLYIALYGLMIASNVMKHL